MAACLCGLSTEMGLFESTNKISVSYIKESKNCLVFIVL
jgi:hypothetical protein